MTYFEAVEPITNTVNPSVFLAGGITGCPDWQADARIFIPLLAEYHKTRPIDIYNPRRADFDVNDPSASERQIAWEYAALHSASVVLFWFAGGDSVQPITLYELGRHAVMSSIVVGADKDYIRRFDVLEQLRHAHPLIRVHDSLAQTCEDAVLSVS